MVALVQLDKTCSVMRLHIFQLLHMYSQDGKAPLSMKNKNCLNSLDIELCTRPYVLQLISKVCYLYHPFICSQLKRVLLKIHCHICTWSSRLVCSGKYPFLFFLSKLRNQPQKFIWPRFQEQPHYTTSIGRLQIQDQLVKIVYTFDIFY